MDIWGSFAAGLIAGIALSVATAWFFVLRYLPTWD